MPDPALLAHARHLVAQQDLAGAQRLLREALARASKDSGEAGEWEAEVAALYAGVLSQLGDVANAGAWADYAYSAMRRLHGERDGRTMHALGVLAVTQHRSGALDLASRSYQQLIAALSAVDGPEAERTLAAKADAAMVDHALGRCTTARALLGQVVAAHKARHGPAHPVGIRMTARLAAMSRDCGDHERARHLLAQAQAQAAALESDDDTHRLLAVTAQTPANREHHCGVGATATPGPQDFLPRSTVEVNTPDLSEWPDDEILDQVPVAAPSHLPPPSAPAPQLPRLVFSPPPAIPPKPREPRRSGLVPLVVIGVLATVAVALVGVAVVASGRKAPPAAATPATSAAAPSAVASGPVTGLKLTDQGDSVLITWQYPAGANGPVIISAAEAGEPMRPMQSLPAGTQSYTLPGLDPKRDYCLTVTVAYSPDHTVMAAPVCTKR